MRNKHLKFTCVALLLIGVLVSVWKFAYFSKIKNQSELSEKPVVVMKSYQSIPVEATNAPTSPQHVDSISNRAPAATKATSQWKRSNGNLMKSRTEFDQSAIPINGASYVWLKNVYAVPAKDEPDGKAPPDFPPGFVLVEQPPIQKSVFEINTKSLNVVQSKSGEKFVLTGAVVVETKTLSSDQISKLLDMPLTYDAGHISTFIYQARDGQDLKIAVAKLPANAAVSRVTIELLGRGVKAQ